jgi:hypothetical protein
VTPSAIASAVTLKVGRKRTERAPHGSTIMPSSKQLRCWSPPLRELMILAVWARAHFKRYWPNALKSTACARLRRTFRRRGKDRIQGTFHAKGTSGEHVRVDHRRSHVTVPEQLLNRANVIAGLQKVRGERMTVMPSSA